ncbi:MAG: DMT family transporter [Candidatus Gastranaerophilaceae bacterium]|nr:cation/cationic drug transporter [Clostridium sp. CAG:967]
MTNLLFLLSAIIFEVAGTTMMKLSNGFTVLLPSVALFIFYAISFCCLTMSLRSIDVSMAYAIWSGFGTALIATIGVIFFHEQINPIKIISLAFIIIGVVGLNLSGVKH